MRVYLLLMPMALLWSSISYARQCSYYIGVSSTQHSFLTKLHKDYYTSENCDFAKEVCQRRLNRLLTFAEDLGVEAPGGEHMKLACA